MRFFKKGNTHTESGKPLGEKNMLSGKAARYLHPGNRKLSGAIPKLHHLLLSFVMCAVNGVIGVIVLFNLRNAVMRTVERSGISVWSFNFIEISTAIIFFVWIIFSFVSQHQYERDLACSKIPKRFLIYTAGRIYTSAARWS